MERRLAREPEAFRFPWQPVEVLQRGCDLLPQEKRRLLRGGGVGRINIELSSHDPKLA
jgi:hypothetical protein